MGPSMRAGLRARVPDAGTAPALHRSSAAGLEWLVCGNLILGFAGLLKLACHEGGHAGDHTVPARLLHDASAR